MEKNEGQEQEQPTYPKSSKAKHKEPNSQNVESGEKSFVSGGEQNEQPPTIQKPTLSVCLKTNQNFSSFR